MKPGPVTGRHPDPTMTAPLPPFGTAQQCVKCTCSDIDDTYQPGQPQILHTGTGAHLLATEIPTGGECLLRSCRDCGWAWLEACADAELPELITGIQTPDGGWVEFTKPMPRELAEQFAADFHSAMEASGLMDSAWTQGPGRDAPA